MTSIRINKFNRRFTRKNLLACLSNANCRKYHNQKYDVAIVGGGVVGMATAQELIKRKPHLKYVVLEKERDLAAHQSSHSSGVIHAGMYYKPGSLKAKLCVQGARLLYDYCNEHNVPYKKVGKLIVATSNDEIMPLQGLYERGKQNKVPGLSLVVNDEIKQIEPHVTGIAALHSMYTGIVDYAVVTKAYAKVFEASGGLVINEFEVNGLDYIETAEQGVCYPVRIQGKGKPDVFCRNVITCGGLHADKLSAITGCSKEPKIIPFRGDYLILKPEKSHLVRGNIYPMPNPQLPFLGVHFTPRMDGSVWLGPNAILAFKREGYKLTDINLNDSADALSHIGLWKLLSKHWKFALKELKDGFYMDTMVKKLQRFIPELTVNDVIRGPSGVRAQALDRNGNLVDDFVFDFGTGKLGKRCLHIRNAPSPAATSSLAIARMIVDKYEREHTM